MRVLVVTHHLAPELLAVWRECARGPDVELHLAGVLDAPSGEAFAPNACVPGWGLSHVFSVVDPVRRGVLWWAYPGLAKVIRFLRPDVVHVNSEAWAVLVTQALRGRAPVVVHGADNMFTHGSPVEVRMRCAVARRNLSRAAAYVSWNAAGARLARDHGLRDGAPTLVAPAVVPDPARFTAVRGERPDRPYTVGFLGRLTPLKGADLLVAAARRAGVARVLVAGDGPERDRLAGPGVELRGTLPQDDVPAFLGELDVLAVPSRTMPDGAEQFGRVVVEAMWAGVPVVASDSGALAEVVGDGGVVVPEGDVGALAAALTELADPACRAAVRARGTERVTAYDPAALAARIAHLWATVA